MPASANARRKEMIKGEQFYAKSPILTGKLGTQKTIWMAKMVCYPYGCRLFVFNVWRISVTIYPLKEQDAKKMIKVVC